MILKVCYIKKRLYLAVNIFKKLIVALMILIVGFKYHQVRAIQGTSNDSVTPLKNIDEPKPQNWKIKMLYDGDCPLCMREVY